MAEGVMFSGHPPAGSTGALGVRDPFAHRPAGYYEAIPEELQRALDGTPALHPDSIPHLWDCILLRYMDPAGRLAPTYPEAIMELAHGIALRWRPSARDLQRLEELGAGDLAGARWLLVLMVLHSSEPSLGEGDPRAMVRTITASTIRVCRRMLRGPHHGEYWRVLKAMERGARDLRKPLEDRLREQWVRAEKKGGMVLEVQELILALTMVSPPSPQEATRLFTEVTDALAGALAKFWRTRGEAASGDKDQKKDLLRHGLLTALAERGVPQKIRRDRVYIEGGRLIRPHTDVDLKEYLRWLKAASIYRAKQEHKGHGPEPGWVDGAEQVLKVPEPGADALNILLEREHEEAIADEVGALLAVASPRQSQILHALLDRLAEGRTWGEAQDRTATDLGMSPSTVRVQIHRLRQKVVA
jgi:hypothetical protein